MEGDSRYTFLLLFLLLALFLSFFFFLLVSLHSRYLLISCNRYLSRELLQDDMSCLRQSDIYALGATLYELVCFSFTILFSFFFIFAISSPPLASFVLTLCLQCRRKPLPANGTEWTQMRDGILHIPDNFSKEFCELLTVPLLFPLALSSHPLSLSLPASFSYLILLAEDAIS